MFRNKLFSFCLVCTRAIFYLQSSHTVNNVYREFGLRRTHRQRHCSHVMLNASSWEWKTAGRHFVDGLRNERKWTFVGWNFLIIQIEKHMRIWQIHTATSCACGKQGNILDMISYIDAINYSRIELFSLSIFSTGFPMNCINVIVLHFNYFIVPGRRNSRKKWTLHFILSRYVVSADKIRFKKV